MELKIWKWKLSIKISKIRKIESKLKATKKIRMEKVEQLQLLALLQQENKKVTENSSMILNVGLTLIVITLSVILLLQGAIGPLASLSNAATTSNTVSGNPVLTTASNVIPSNSLPSNTMAANVISQTVSLQVENFIITFQAVFFVIYVAIPVIWLLTQLLANVYRKRVKELKQYMLDTYEIDDDIKKIMAHVIKD